MRRLFVHIGTHKTGTTSFQSFLWDRRETLREEGVAVCAERTRLGAITNCLNLANSVLRPDLMTPARMTGFCKTPGFWQRSKAVAVMRGMLSDKLAESVILSAEAFCFARQPEELKKVRRLLSFPGTEVIPVVAFRRDEAWRESWHNHIARWEPKFTLPHGEGAGDIRGDWYFDKDAILGFWNQIGPVRVVNYEDAMARDGSIIPSLLGAMEVEDVGPVDGYFTDTRPETVDSL